MGTATPTTRVYGGAMIVAPLLLLAATATFVAAGSFYESKEAGAIQLVAMAVMAVAVVGLTRSIETDFPRLAALLALAGGLGAVGGAGFGVERIYTGLGADRLEGIAVGAASLYPLGLLFPLSMIGFGLAISRARTSSPPAWAGWALAAGGALFPVSRIGDVLVLALVADSLLALGLVTAGLALMGEVAARRETTAARAATA